jgi:hypothetical protein
VLIYIHPSNKIILYSPINPNPHSQKNKPPKPHIKEIEKKADNSEKKNEKKK